MLMITCRKYELNWIRNVITPKLSAQMCDILGVVLTKSSPNDLWYKGPVGISLHATQLMLAIICANRLWTWFIPKLWADHGRQQVDGPTDVTSKSNMMQTNDTTTLFSLPQQRDPGSSSNTPYTYRWLSCTCIVTSSFVFLFRSKTLNHTLTVFTPDEQWNKFKDKTSYHYSSLDLIRYACHDIFHNFICSMTIYYETGNMSSRR